MRSKLFRFKEGGHCEGSAVGQRGNDFAMKSSKLSLSFHDKVDLPGKLANPGEAGLSISHNETVKSMAFLQLS